MILSFLPRDASYYNVKRGFAIVNCLPVRQSIRLSVTLHGIKYCCVHKWLAVSSESGGRNYRRYLFCLQTEGWPGWVGLGRLVEYKDGKVCERSLVTVLTGLNVD